MKRTLRAVALTCSIISSICTSLGAAVPVVWDGSAGISGNTSLPHNVRRWEEGNWTKNGVPGQTAAATMGNNTGGNGGLDIVIGGGVTVYHDHNDPDDIPAALGDFKPKMWNHPDAQSFNRSSLTIKEGATLWMDSHSDDDGRWTRMNIDLNLDGGTLRRTVNPAWCNPSDCSVSGGKLIFGYRNEMMANSEIAINITNGGRIESHGKVTFGDVVESFDSNEYSGTAPGIKVAMTINDGTLDLTGGRAWDDFLHFANGELVFFYEWNEVTNQPKNPDYSINFTGPGSITVDSGIYVVGQDSSGVYYPMGGAPELYTSIEYQDLWDLGILQANGQSGLTGAVFSNYFTVTGAPDVMDIFGDVAIDNNNYTLTSLLTAPGQEGDHNQDGVVNAADYVTGRKLPGSFGGFPAWYTSWRGNFGESGSGSSSPVPEPSSLLIVMIGATCIGSRRRSRAG